MALSIMDYVMNNAKHFGSFGSDLPTAYLAPVVAEEHDPEHNYSPGEFTRKLLQIANDARDTSDQFVGGSDNNPSSKPYRPVASRIIPAKVEEVDFINADLAKHYGMTKATAYQEALSNTAYQRSVQDMKAAGLNPAVLFGSGRATPASASIYASDHTSVVGGSRRRSSGSSNGQLFSGSAYSAIQAIGGLVGLALTKRPDGFWIGSQTAKGTMGLLDAVSGRK